MFVLRSFSALKKECFLHHLLRPEVTMALKAFHVSDVLIPNQVPHTPPFVFAPNSLAPHLEDLDVEAASSIKMPKFLLIGHRGSGMNVLQSPDRRTNSIKENSIASFNEAGKSNADFIEFDVQVTKDDCPVIFHDNFIITEEKGSFIERRVTNLTLDQFFSYGPQRNSYRAGKPLFRTTEDGQFLKWRVEKDDVLCTLQDAFEKVENSLGFDIELKFDDNVVYKEDELIHAVQVVMKVVTEYAKKRPIIFSSFHPDAALLIRKIQHTYPVFFLTEGGTEIYSDKRRNSLDEAISMCLSGGLHGIVSDVTAVIRNPTILDKIQQSKLSLITYGQLNNAAEVVRLQQMVGVHGVIVDLVKEVAAFILNLMPGKTHKQLHFSKNELSFLLKMVSKFIQQ